jgi:hypothetical protein
MTMAVPLGAASVVVLTTGLMALEPAPSSQPMAPDRDLSSQPMALDRAPSSQPPGSALMPALPAAAEYVPGADEKYPRLRYADGQISLNDRCPVRHAKLNPRMAPVYVNGKPIGFC